MKMISNVNGVCTYKTSGGEMIGTRDLPDFINGFKHARSGLNKRDMELYMVPHGIMDNRLSMAEQLKAIRKKIH